MEVPFSRPYLRGDEGAAVAEAIASGWVSQGPRVREFEAAFAERVGAADAVATTNCTTALQLALYVSGVGPGDEVIVPSMSFIATANAVWQNGATPVFADVDPRTYNLDPAAAERAITERTKAIMPVHQLGLPADMDPFLALAERHGLAIVEDAACAIGARYKGRPIGSLGPLACFSLHPRKVITTGEGGMIAVHDPEVAARLRQLRQHAMDVSDLARHGATRRRHRVLSRARLELPHDRHAGGARALPARAARRDPRRARGGWPSATPRRSSAIPYLEPPYEPEYARADLAVLRGARSPPDAPIERTELMRRLLHDGVADAPRRDGDPRGAGLRRRRRRRCRTPRRRRASR